MKTAHTLPLFLSTCFIFTSIVLNGASRAAGFHDSAPFRGHVPELSIQARIANETNRIIVKYRRMGAGAAAVSSVTRQVTQITGHAMSHLGSTGANAEIFMLEETLPLEEVQDITREIEANPDVEYAEPDRRVFPLYTPTDPQYNEQWHYFEDTAGIRVPDAWDTSRGENVLVAIIDTGYTDHVDLVDNIQLPGIDLMSDTSMSNDGDGRDQDAHDPGDRSPECGLNMSTWHGTHTAGTIAAIGDNGIGVIGIAFNAKVLPVRVLGKCGGWLSDFADGIIWSAGGDLSGLPANQTPAQVLNLSLGIESSDCSQYMQQAIDRARELGSTVVVAAGNSGSDVSGFEPANCNGVIAVAATDRDGNRASFSNYGNAVDIAAPGTRILSTTNSGITAPGNDIYAYREGTSMATPQVSATAALLYAIKPDITPVEVEQILKDTARAFPGTCNECGSGLLDATAAVAALSGMKPDPQPGLVMLHNGISQTDIFGERDDNSIFAIDVPQDAGDLSFSMGGGRGDADLYVLFGFEPTLDEYDCRPYLYGNNETCRIPNPQLGRYYVVIHGYSDFSGVSLLAAYEESTQPDPDTASFENTDDFAIPGFNLYGVGSPIEVSLTGMSGTADVHVDIKHPNMHEVAVILVSPDGQSLILSFGGQGTNLDKTYTLNLDDIPASGIWTLYAIDFGQSGQGYIDSWGITFRDRT